VQVLWESFLSKVKEEAGSQVVENWFRSVSLKVWDREQKEMTLLVPNSFVRNWIRKNYFDLIKKHLTCLARCETINFKFEITKNGSNSDVYDNDSGLFANGRGATEQATFSSLPLLVKKDAKKTSGSAGKKDSLLDHRHVFKTFVVGPHNHLAYSAGRAVALGTGKSYNPLFIYGRTGLGKTHLLHSIGNEFKEKFPNSKVIYKSSDSFVNEFIKAIRVDKMHAFREKYNKADLLLLDDIQFFAQKEQTQEVFFNIFNKMHGARKQIVLSSDVPPAQISGLQDRLKSRFEWGLIADVHKPSLETKIAILLKKAEENSLRLDSSVAAYIATKMDSSVREMEGALTKLGALTMLTGCPISLEMAQRELSLRNEAVGVSKGRNSWVIPQQILSVVGKIYGASVDDIKSRSRRKNIAKARQVGAYLLKKHSKGSLKSIGDSIGGRNHSTVIHAISQINRLLKNDDELVKEVSSIEETFFSHA
jgi:chromosomal replication initiator protein